MALSATCKLIKEALPRLPLYISLGRNEVPAVLDAMNDNDVDSAYMIYKKAASQVGGIDKNEVPIDTLDNFKKYLATTLPFMLRDAKTKKPMGLSCKVPSPLQRSIRPKSTAGMGLGGPMTILHASLGSLLGYDDIVGRTSILSRGVKGMVMSGGTWYGTIPYSTEEPKVGWRDDLIIVNHFSNTLSPMYKDRLSTPLLPLVAKRPPPGSFDVSPWKHSFSCGLRAELRNARTDEQRQVHALFRVAANEGKGFSPDEFTTDGELAAKLLQDINYLLAVDEVSGDIIGAILHGRSALCRSKVAPIAHAYIALDKMYQGRSIGAEFFQEYLNYCENQFEMRGILTTAFVTDSTGLKMLEKLGFSVRGSIPNSGSMKNSTRLLNDVMLYKEFKTFDFSSLPGFHAFVSGMAAGEAGD